MAHVERLTCYPVKGLDELHLEEATILEGGTLERDREFRLVDDDGDVFNGKRTDRVHDVETTYDPERTHLTVDPRDGERRASDRDGERRASDRDGERRTFDLETEREAAAAWCSEFFEEPLALERSGPTGFVDRPSMGPSVISTATLRKIASWYEDVTVAGARRRLRANVEVGGVPAFWEDRFVGEDAPAFAVGDVRFEGVTPCGRCVVPTRDPDTGEPIEDFQERFVERRRETFPEWADEAAFDHFYTVMLIASVPESHRGATIAEGDPVQVLEA